MAVSALFRLVRKVLLRGRIEFFESNDIQPVARKAFKSVSVLRITYAARCFATVANVYRDMSTY
jgi:hypothetical protein